MLHLYRRHLNRCPHRSKGMGYKKCPCPIWVHGTLEGRRVRFSLDTQNWELAAEKALNYEAGNGKESTLIKDATDAYIENLKTQHVKDDTVERYEYSFEELKNFAARKGLKFISHLDVPALREWQSELEIGPSTARKRVERLRSFFKFCMENGWTQTNPAAMLKMPKVRQSQVFPFTDEEWKKILAACDKYPERNSFGYDLRKRMKAFVLLLRYSGLRISDGVGLRRERLKGNKLFLYQHKTGTAVSVPLPKSVVNALLAVDNRNRDYFFWTAEGELDNSITHWQRALKRVFKIAGVDGHAHKFRHTFAVGLLQNGVPLEDVSILLGHNSLKITEKHYSAFVEARQNRLEKLVMSAWRNHKQK